METKKGGFKKKVSSSLITASPRNVLDKLDGRKIEKEE
jgi:hypothetical protein